MPAIITHDLFGKDVYGETFDTIGGSRDAAEAFLLGNQGPDPLFFVAPDPRYRRVGKLASTLHRARPAEFLVALKSAVRCRRRSAPSDAPTRWATYATTCWTARCIRSS